MERWVSTADSIAFVFRKIAKERLYYDFYLSRQFCALFLLLLQWGARFRRKVFVLMIIPAIVLSIRGIQFIQSKVVFGESGTPTAGTRVYIRSFSIIIMLTFNQLFSLASNR